MKTFLTLIFVLISNLVLTQVVSYETFDSDLLNKKVLIEINKLRRSRGIDTLVTSVSVYNIYSKPNCIEVAGSGKFYHPETNERFNNQYLRTLITEESKKMYGGQNVLLSDGSPRMNEYENGFKSTMSYNSYDELAQRIVIAWENSPSHKEVQNLSYVSANIPGVFACHSVMNSDGTIFVFVNYIKIFRS
jgi:hypothetical protein